MNEQEPAESGARLRGTTLRAAAPRVGERPGGTQEPDLPQDRDRRNLSRAVPRIAGLFCMLIGVSDILSVVIPAWHNRLRRFHRIVQFVPGTELAVASTAIAITGLMLLMLSYGMRRRKRRAWQAVVALLAFNIVIHLFHGVHIVLALISLVMLGALLYFSDHFYARGDPRTRWRALYVFCWLVVGDVAI